MIENLFLSVGAMKAGTTWLYEQLKDHPDILFTPEKEIHYLANAVGIENQLNHRNRLLKLKAVLERFGKGNPKYISEHIDEIDWYVRYAKPKEISNDWYKELFSDQGRKYCADFSNLYCQMGTEGWNNVRSLAKNIKVIYTLRNPLDRVWSHYKFHLKWIGKENEVISLGFEEFKNTLDKEHFWQNAKYADNYANLKTALRDNELMLLYFDDFRKSPVLMLNKICEFLDISTIDIKSENLEKKVNRTKEFKFPEAWRDYANQKLSTEIEAMQNSGLWKESWESKI